MIYQFRLVSDEVDNFKREIEIDADATFLSLRNAICDSVGYERPPMCSFFVCDEGWEKGPEITLEDMDADSDHEVYLMADTPLSDFLDDEGQRLIFVFDYLTDRSFFLELKKTRPGEYLNDPICTLSMGQAPAQYVDLQEFDDQIDAKAAAAAKNDAIDLDVDFYGSDSYNEDEYDAEGFGELIDE